VGGAVRDLLLGIQPKDFDVATDATPEQIRKLFRNCRLIGRRFRLAHIHFGREYIEVATFRGRGDGAEDDDRKVEDGRLIFDNVYGSIEEDALRRDFTVNGLYYGIADFAIRDFSTGMADLEGRKIRLIGDPEDRYREDPVRLLRAIRFAAKLDFTIEASSEAPIRAMGELLHDIPPARLFEEVLKLFMSGHARRSLDLLIRYDLLGRLFPETARALKGEDGEAMLAMLRAAMENTDQRIEEGKPVTPAFLFATLLWQPMITHADALEAKGASQAQAIAEAGEWIVRQQAKHTAVPRRFSVPMREIWQLQPRFKHQQGKRVKRLLSHPRFRAGYDFLLLRAVADPSLEASGEWWTEVQECSGKELEKKTQPRKRGRGRRRGRGRGRERQGEQPA